MSLVKIISKYKFLCLPVLIFCVHFTNWSIQNAQAQDGNPNILGNEILQFSIHNAVTGSSRMQALSGAGVALGGDISTSHYNPAGLGIMRSTVLTLSPSLGFNTIKSTYHNNSRSQLDIVPSIKQAGVVIPSFSNYQLDNGWGFLGGAIALNITEVNNYNSDYIYEGINNQYSYIDYLRSLAYGKSLQHMRGLKTASEDGMGFNLFLIDPIFFQQSDNPRRLVQGKEYDSQVLGSPTQRQRVQDSGYNYKFDISYGANFSNKLMVGASLSFNAIAHYSKKTYEEFDFYYEENVLDGNNNPILDENGNNETRRVKNNNIINIKRTAETSIQGGGVSFTLGALYIPIPALRFGAKIQLPSLIFNTREASTDLDVNYGEWNRDDVPVDLVPATSSTEDDVVTTSSETLGDEFVIGDLYVSKYKIITPMLLSGGVSFFVNDKGFISTEIEYIDYAASSMSSNDFDTSRGNDYVKDNVRAVLNYKFGGELRVDPFRLRGGVNFIQNPYTKSTKSNYNVGYTGGIGVIFNKEYSADFTLTHNAVSYTTSPYYFPDNEFTADPDNNPDTNDGYMNSVADTGIDQLVFAVTITYRP